MVAGVLATYVATIVYIVDFDWMAFPCGYSYVAMCIDSSLHIDRENPRLPRADMRNICDHVFRPASNESHIITSARDGMPR